MLFGNGNTRSLGPLCRQFVALPTAVVAAAVAPVRYGLAFPRDGFTPDGRAAKQFRHFAERARSFTRAMTWHMVPRTGRALSSRALEE